MGGFTSKSRVSPSKINVADSLSVDMTISHMQWSNQSDGAIPPESDLIYSEPVSSTSDVADETTQSTTRSYIEPQPTTKSAPNVLQRMIQRRGNVKRALTACVYLLRASVDVEVGH